MCGTRSGNIKTDEDWGQLRQPVELLRRMVPGLGEMFAARLPRRCGAHLKDKSEMGARPSTLRLAEVAIACNHKNAGFDVPVHHGVAWSVLDELTREDVPGSSRALPLDMDCYLSITKTADQLGSGRGWPDGAHC